MLFCLIACSCWTMTGQSADEKSRLTVKDLLAKFYELQGEELSSDKMLLA